MRIPVLEIEQVSNDENAVFLGVIMPKQGFLLADVPKLFSTANDKPGWALCIGAGTSVPLFPDWYSLGSEMAKQLVPETPFNVEALKKSGFSPDSMIQAAFVVRNFWFPAESSPLY
jgi:hypothetical protein